MTSYEQAIADALARADKRANQDKWMAVAQAGLALMSSKQPTLGGALGEAGMTGIGAYRSSRDEAEKTKMDLLATQYQMDMDRQKMALARAGGGGGGGKPIPATLINNLETKRATIAAALEGLPPPDEGGWFSGPSDPAAADRTRLAQELEIADMQLAQAYATHGVGYVPYGGAGAYDEEADLADQ
jgi:hypothetical protein